MIMKVVVRDKNLLQKVRDNDGYCICALVHDPDTKCMCREFRDTEPTKDGVTCHCGVYTKYKEDDV